MNINKKTQTNDEGPEDSNVHGFTSESVVVSNRVPERSTKVASYLDCSVYARACGIETMRQWFDYHRVKDGGKPRPPGIPGDPSHQYREVWKGWPQFLGTNNVASAHLSDTAMSLTDAKAWFIKNEIQTVKQFRVLCTEGLRPPTIPACPEKFYNVKYSELLAPKSGRYLGFHEARNFVHSFEFNDYLEFRAYKRNNPEMFEKIPSSPDRVYMKSSPPEWTSWPDFLGYNRITRTRLEE
jgi:hypothetical protein